MADVFSFQLAETFLQGYADYCKHLRETTGKGHHVTITVDLIPDGVGYETSGPPQIVVEEDGDVTKGEEVIAQKTWEYRDEPAATEAE